MVALSGIVACACDDGLSQFGQVEFAVPERGTQGGAQTEGVGAGLDEPGAVCGVLNAVGEHQRFLFGSVKVFVAE